MAAAKRLVFGKVGIDMIAGPSEVLVLADKHGNPDWIAADLLAQAEHDAAAQSILITDDAALADAVEKAVAAQLTTLPRGAVAGASWRDFGAIILVRKLDEAVPLVDALAPEHLEIDDRRRRSGWPAKIRNAGAIFLGAHTPEAIGDYVAGSNHVLPTARSARFSSGPRRARLHEAHLDPEMRPGAARGARAGRDRARRGRRARRACPLGRDPPQPAMSAAPSQPIRNRLVAVTLDEDSIGRSSPDIEHERAVAIYDLIEENSFAPVGHDGGPYALHLEHRRQPAGVRHPLARTARRWWRICSRSRRCAGS